MIKCQICQHDNPEGAEYCGNCGAALATTEAPATRATPADSPAGAQEATPAQPQAPETPVPDMPAPTDATATALESDPDEAQSSSQENQDAAAGPSDTASGVGGDASTEVDAPVPVAHPRLVANRYGATSGEEIPLLGEKLVVGRFDPETGPVDIDLSQAPEASQISRHHAQLYREADGQWYVADLGSTNGVFVKAVGGATFGPRLTAPQGLSSGDEVAFGNARFIFRVD